MKLRHLFCLFCYGLLFGSPVTHHTMDNSVSEKGLGFGKSEEIISTVVTPKEFVLSPIEEHFSYPFKHPGQWFIYQNFQIYSRSDGGFHAGEDWMIKPNTWDADFGYWLVTVNQLILSVADGQVMYAEMVNYPCGVLIVGHKNVFSVYSHLDRLVVAAGQIVELGQPLGQVCMWPGDMYNSHLHFEIRSFYLKDYINGEQAACGRRHKNFPPGPGYWPVCQLDKYQDLPVTEGWLSPSEFIRSH